MTAPLPWDLSIWARALSSALMRSASAIRSHPCLRRSGPRPSVRRYVSGWTLEGDADRTCPAGGPVDERPNGVHLWTTLSRTPVRTAATRGHVHESPRAGLDRLDRRRPW